MKKYIVVREFTRYHVSLGNLRLEIKQKPLLWDMKANAGCMKGVFNNVGR